MLTPFDIGLLFWQPYGRYKKDKKFYNKVKEYTKKLNSETRPTLFVILFSSFLFMMYLYPNGTSQFELNPDNATLLLFGGFIQLISISGLMQGVIGSKARDPKKLSEFFDTPEKLIKKMAKPLPTPEAPFAIKSISVLFYYMGGIIFSVFAILVVTTLLGTPIYNIKINYLFGLGIGTLFIGGGSLGTARALRKMDKWAAVAAVMLCLVPFVFNPFIYPLNQIPPSPFINTIWWFGIPLVVIFFIKKHWKKFKWRERFLFEHKKY